MEFLASVPPAVWAMIGTAFGGVGLKLVERYLNRGLVRINEKKDYREEIHDLRTRLDKVEQEVDTWRERYYHNEEEIHALRAFIISQGQQPPTRRPLPPRP